MNDAPDEPLIIASPLYLLAIEQPCWACAAPVVTIAVATTNLIDPELEDADAYRNEVCLLSNVPSWPPELLAEIQALHPAFQLRFSQSMETDYYMVICACGAHQGDHFVHKALFNAACYESDRINAKRLTATGHWRISCGFSSSSAYEPILAKL